MEGLDRTSSGTGKSITLPTTTFKFYTIDGIKIGKEIGLGGRINTVLQSAFFKLANIIPEDRSNRT